MLFILLVLLSINIYADNKDQKPYQIGYTTKYLQGKYNSDYYIENLEQPNIYYVGSIKSPQRPFSGNWLDDLEDWTRMNGILGLGYDENWPSYVDEDYWLQFLSEYSEYENEAEKYFVDRGQAPPWKVPIGNSTVLIIFTLLVFIKKLYIRFVRRSKKYSSMV